jgi:hypothetical protein
MQVVSLFIFGYIRIFRKFRVVQTLKNQDSIEIAKGMRVYLKFGVIGFFSNSQVKSSGILCKSKAPLCGGASWYLCSK